MKLTVALQLKPDEKQAQCLLATLERANQAANRISQQAWDNRIFQKFKLQNLIYYPIRQTFELTAQMVVRLVAKVCDAYKLNKKRLRVFRKHGSIAYDDRILSYKADKISIWTLKGRETIPFICGEYQQKLLQFRQGESDLVYREGKWYLLAVVDLIEPASDEPDDFLGVDLGIVQIATMSNGDAFAGRAVNNVRARNVELRAKLQSKDTKSAKRLLKKRNSKEANFARQVNHHLSKCIVQTAKAQSQGIAIENLMGIRDRIKRLRRRQRYTLHSWSFYQLASFILYKARKEGVRVAVVDPRYTSQTCAECGYCCRENRRSQAQFQCVSCGFVAHADHNAARVISYLGRASVNKPYAVSCQSARLVG